jgi:hypothetical protein
MIVQAGLCDPPARGWGPSLALGMTDGGLTFPARGDSSETALPVTLDCGCNVVTF